MRSRCQKREVFVEHVDYRVAGVEDTDENQLSPEMTALNSKEVSVFRSALSFDPLLESAGKICVMRAPANGPKWGPVLNGDGCDGKVVSWRRFCLPRMQTVAGIGLD